MSTRWIALAVAVTLLAAAGVRAQGASPCASLKTLALEKGAQVVLTPDLGIECALEVVAVAQASLARVSLARGFPADDVQSLYERGASCLSQAGLERALLEVHQAGHEVFVRERDVSAEFLSRLLEAGADRVIVETSIPTLDRHDRYYPDFYQKNSMRVKPAVTYATQGAKVVIRQESLQEEDEVFREIARAGRDRVWFMFHSVSGLSESTQPRDMRALIGLGGRIILFGRLSDEALVKPALRLAADRPGRVFVPSTSLVDDYWNHKLLASGITVFDPGSPPYRRSDPRAGKFSELYRRSGVE